MKLIACVIIMCSLGNAVAAPLLPVPARAPAAKVSMQDCGDFLAQMQKKPAHATYAGCSYLPDRQGKPLRATYRVSGRFAGAVESYLVKAVGLHRLKRSCCQWDAPVRQFRDAIGRDFSISMVSEETLVASRSDWRRITVFEITLEIFTEEI